MPMIPDHAPISPAASRAQPLPAARRLLSVLSLLSLAALGAGLAGCGHGRHHEGDIVARNDSDLTVPEAMLSFQVARFRDDFTGDLLGAPLEPGSSDFIGTFREDWYDATAELELGDIYDWPDTYVGYERTSVFAFD